MTSKLTFKKRQIILLLTVFLLFVLVPTTFAYEKRADDDIIIKADEVINDDLYVAGNSIIINGTINGDVVGGANKIVINGTINGDLLAGGNEITINGTVTDDVRVGASAFTLSEGATVGDDLAVFGFSTAINEGATVGGDAYGFGYQVLQNGHVAGDLAVGAGGLEINGSVGGNVDANIGSAEDAPPMNPVQFMPNMPKVPSVSAGLTVSDNAEIGGDLSYTANEEIGSLAKAVSGSINFAENKIETEVQKTVAQRTLGRVWRAVQSWIVLFIVGLLLLRFLPTWVANPSDTFNDKPVPTLVGGLLLLFGLPIALAILVGIVISIAALLGAIKLGGIGTTIALVGIAVMGLTFICYLLILGYLAQIIVGNWLGNKIMKDADRAWMPLAIGLFIVVALAAIPVIGGITGFIVSIIGLGAIGLYLWSRRGSNSKLEKAAMIA